MTKENKALLERTLKKLLGFAPEQLPELFVFDIDSTLYNVTPRNLEIIRHFAKHNQELNPEIKTALSKVTASINDWGIKAPLQRLNLDFDEEFIKKIKLHWNKHFFSGDFLHLDEIYPGAIDFVNFLSQLSPTYYLTGRDILRMGDATLIQLKNSGFPVDPTHNRLILKPEQKLLDHEYKLAELKKLSENFKSIYFFENEPVILNAVKTHLPSVTPIFINSTHSGRAIIDDDITVILPNFEMEPLKK